MELMVSCSSNAPLFRASSDLDGCVSPGQRPFRRGRGAFYNTVQKHWQVEFCRITADPFPWGKFTPPTKQQCGETLGGLEPLYDLFTFTSEFTLPKAVTQTCDIFVSKAGSFSYGESPRTPPSPSVKELHSTDETTVWRDPRGSWACLWHLFTITSEFTLLETATQRSVVFKLSHFSQLRRIIADSSGPCGNFTPPTKH